MPIALTIAHGTAVAALDASSEMWTLESKPQIVHRGERKLKMNAYPLVQPLTAHDDMIETMIRIKRISHTVRKVAESITGIILEFLWRSGR